MANVFLEAADTEVRSSGIGSSDSAAICGLSKWRAPLDVYLSKRGLIEFQDNEAMEWGRIIEPLILREYARRNACWVLGRRDTGRATLWGPQGGESPCTDEALTQYLGTLRDTERPWRMAHLDGFVLDENRIPARIIEGKTSSVYRTSEWGEGPDEIPEEYVVQTTHASGVFRAAYGRELPVDIPVLIGGQKFRIYTVEYRESLDEKLIEAESEFWHTHIIGGEAPSATPDELGKAGLSVLFPKDEGEEVVISPDSELHQFAMDIKAAKRRLDDAEKYKIGVENALKEQMKDASKFLGDGWSVTWKKTKDGETVDWQAVARAFVLSPAYEETVKRNTTPKPGFRRFVCKFDKEGD